MNHPDPRQHLVMGLIGSVEDGGRLYDFNPQFHNMVNLLAESLIPAMVLGVAQQAVRAQQELDAAIALAKRLPTSVMDLDRDL